MVRAPGSLSAGPPVVPSCPSTSWVFCKKTGRLRSPTKFRLNDLRHSFASRAPALGETLPMIGKLLGHTLVQTTARYAHLAHDTVKASAARIGDSIEQDLHVSEVTPPVG